MNFRQRLAFMCRTCVLIGLSFPIQLHAQGFTSEERKVYIYHREEIDSLALLNSNEEISFLKMNYLVSTQGMQAIAPILLRQEQRKLTYNYMYPNEHAIRAKAKKNVEADYRNRIDSALILSNDISGENTTTVLRKGYAFGLSSQQYDSLMVRAVAMRQYLQAHPKEEIWTQDVDALKDILTEKQFNSYFNVKHAREASRKSKEVWDALKVSGYAEKLDSVSDFPRIYQYELSILKTNDIYKGRDNLRENALKKIEVRMPEAIKMYKFIIRKQQIEKKRSSVQYQLTY